jgi:hypothetical protein
MLHTCSLAFFHTYETPCLPNQSEDKANIALHDIKKSHNYPQSMTHMGLRLDAQFAS